LALIKIVQFRSSVLPMLASEGTIRPMSCQDIASQYINSWEYEGYSGEVELDGNG
jgi:hypothetical protein